MRWFFGLIRPIVLLCSENLAMKHSQDLAALSKAPLQLQLYKLPGSIINLLRNLKVIAE